MFKKGDILQRDVDSWLGTFEIMDISDTTMIEDTHVNIRNRDTNYIHTSVCLGKGPPWVLYKPLTPIQKEMNHRMVDSLIRFGD